VIAAAAKVLVVGLSHKTASVASREQFQLVGAEARKLTSHLHQHPEILEVAAIATCNRSELVLVVSDETKTLPIIVSALGAFSGADTEQLSTVIACHSGPDAIRYVLRVASGIESVVLGEAQVQGQLKACAELARELGTIGPVLDRLFSMASIAGKRARTETSIGDGNASIGTAAARLLEQRLGNLAESRITVLGAGEMGVLAARSLADRGANHVVIANRDEARGARAAEQGNATAVSIKQLSEELVSADAVIGSTAAPHAVITYQRVAEALRARNGRPLVLLDLAVPRDIEPAVSTLAGCQLFDLDDLERVVADTLREREREIPAVLEVVEDVAQRFERWVQERSVAPQITALREHAEQIRQSELARFDGRLRHLAPEDKRRVEHLTESIVNRILHGPILDLRESAVNSSEPSLTR
jgi:glutamyl-tRNA reductase